MQSLETEILRDWDETKTPKNGSRDTSQDSITGRDTSQNSITGVGLRSEKEI